MPYREPKSLLPLDKVITASAPVSDGCICYPVAIPIDVKQFDLRQKWSVTCNEILELTNTYQSPRKYSHYLFCHGWYYISYSLP